MVTTAEPQQEMEGQENPIDSKLSRFGETALHKAAINNNIEECCMLIALGADLNSVDNYGTTFRPSKH
ncbi:Ank 5 domain containing protein [Trichuris trichiura]|uniref:Ank 5 domain containing protein n=1 Tax=Trichuris trichiura TaxID=36087 RepID=A0A077YYU0_TRITR|nr:Ank 5 domain containing protein [Trichuris trichiura]